MRLDDFPVLDCDVCGQQIDPTRFHRCPPINGLILAELKEIRRVLEQIEHNTRDKATRD